jgi:hypothetical protein
MMEWPLAALLFIGALALLPTLLRRSRKSRRKGTAGGIIMGIGFAFMTLFDPGKSEAVEEIRRRSEAEEEDESGAPPA